jgi:hypothetical protein
MLVKPVTCGDSYAKNCGSKAGTGPSGFETVPFTLGEGLLSNVFGWLADRIGARTMLIAGPEARRSPMSGRRSVRKSP